MDLLGQTKIGIAQRALTVEIPFAALKNELSEYLRLIVNLLAAVRNYYLGKSHRVTFANSALQSQQVLPKAA